MESRQRLNAKRRIAAFHVLKLLPVHLTLPTTPAMAAELSDQV